MKIFDVISTANTNLFRNKGRTILTIIAIVIGAFTISLTVGIRNGVNEYMDKQMKGVGAKDQLLIKPDGQSGTMENDKPKKYDPEKNSGAESTYITDQNLKDIESKSAIKDVKPLYNYTTDYVKGESKNKYLLTVTKRDGMNIDLEEGHQVDDKSKAYEVNLANEYLSSLGYSSAKDALGNMIDIAVSDPVTKTQEIVKAKIVGVRNTSLLNSGSTIINKALASKIEDINDQNLPDTMRGKFYGAMGTLKNDISKKELRDLKKSLKKKGFIASTLDDQLKTFKQITNAITGALTLFGAIALLAASFGIINTLYMSVQDRTREIGLMKAMGMKRGQVFSMFSLEAISIGFWGAILGILLSTGVGKLLNDFAADSFLKSFKGFNLLAFNFSSSLIIMLIILLIAFLAGTFPANRAARLDPINSLRYE